MKYGFNRGNADRVRRAVHKIEGLRVGPQSRPTEIVPGIYCVVTEDIDDGEEGVGTMQQWSAGTWMETPWSFPIVNETGRTLVEDESVFANWESQSGRYVVWSDAHRTLWQGYLKHDAVPGVYGQSVTSSGEVLRFTEESEAVPGFTLSGASNYTLEVPEGTYWVSYSGCCSNATASGTKYDVSGAIQMEKYNGSTWDIVEFSLSQVTLLVLGNMVSGRVNDTASVTVSRIFKVVVPSTNRLYRLWAYNDDSSLSGVQPLTLAGASNVPPLPSDTTFNWCWLEVG